MARKALIEKHNRKPKFEIRKKNRCNICGRPRGFMGKFDMCRICFRKLASSGYIPGVTKSSW